MAKRFFDLVVALSSLSLIWPVLMVIALVVRLDSPGPVFYRQTRVGRNGENFGMYKFRSMVVDADRVGGYQTQQGDPRITRSGRWLRKTSLDELPQLLNVVLGDMSLVGPRPDVPAQRALYTPEQWAARTSVRPGITGLAQATMRSEAHAAQRLNMDLEYVRTRSLWLDFRILLMTVRQVLGKGSF
jgi:lipopolysaccharide/colanic/teichoic acid biosynthesis glycosyltransferase